MFFYDFYICFCVSGFRRGVRRILGRGRKLRKAHLIFAPAPTGYPLIRCPGNSVTIEVRKDLRSVLFRAQALRSVFAELRLVQACSGLLFFVFEGGGRLVV